MHFVKIGKMNIKNIRIVNNLSMEFNGRKYYNILVNLATKAKGE